MEDGNDKSDAESSKKPPKHTVTIAFSLLAAMSQGSTVFAGGVAVATIAPYTIPAIASDIVAASNVVSSATASASSVVDSATGVTATPAASTNSPSQSTPSSSPTTNNSSATSSPTSSTASTSTSQSTTTSSSPTTTTSSPTPTPTSSTAAPPTSQPPTSSLPPSGLSQSSKIGLGLGIPLGILLLAALAFLIRRHSRYAQASRHRHSKALDRGGFDTLEAANGIGGGGAGMMRGGGGTEKVEGGCGLAEIDGRGVSADPRELVGDGGVRRVEMA